MWADVTIQVRMLANAQHTGTPIHSLICSQTASMHSDLRCNTTQDLNPSMRFSLICFARLRSHQRTLHVTQSDCRSCQVAHLTEDVTCPSLTHICYAGKGIAGEQSLCYTWFARSSKQYVPEATYKLAQCKEDGWGCAVNMQEAVVLYTEAADGVYACVHACLCSHCIRLRRAAGSVVSWLMSPNTHQLQCF